MQTSGYATLSGGKVSIDLIRLAAAVSNRKRPWSLPLHRQGSSNGVYLAEVSGKGFKVAENNDGKSSVTISALPSAKGLGENPNLPREVISSDYNQNLARGLHNDAGYPNQRRRALLRK
ncbi:MAG: hypothetical protein IPH20_23255 [Bacteroidales bacterium]|nr:hypothetical protein [Bacteroidales bacterium]